MTTKNVLRTLMLIVCSIISTAWSMDTPTTITKAAMLQEIQSIRQKIANNPTPLSRTHNTSPNNVQTKAQFAEDTLKGLENSIAPYESTADVSTLYPELHFVKELVQFSLKYEEIHNWQPLTISPTILPIIALVGAGGATITGMAVLAILIHKLRKKKNHDPVAENSADQPANEAADASLCGVA